MSKMTYGFPLGTNKDAAKMEAVEKATNGGLLTTGDTYTVDFVEDEEHEENNEFVVVIRKVQA